MPQITFSFDYTDPNLVHAFIDQLNNGLNISVQTSGSTGKPKVISFSFLQIKQSALATNSYLNLTEHTKALLCMNPKVIAGKMMIARSYFGNYSLHVAPASKRPLEKIEIPIDFIAMVPLQLAESLKYDLEKLKKIKTILIGGGPISLRLEEKLRGNNLTVYHSFGMTETVSHVALRKVGLETEEEFHALPGIVFSEKNKQLIIHAPKLQIVSLETNDIVDLQSSTSFKWLGRKDFVVNSGGYKLHPEMLENKWAIWIKTPFFLWKEPDEKWGEKLVMYIEGTNWPKLKEEDLTVLFEKHEMPKVYYLCQVFVTTESGKINRMETAKLTNKSKREKAF